jgi:hypothetical protein
MPRSAEFKGTVSLKGLETIKEAVDPKMMRAAIVAATNKVARMASTAASKAVRQDYAVKAGELRGAVRVFPAKNRRGFRIESTIQVKGGRLPLIRFGARQTKQGVSFKVMKTGPRKVIKGAFINPGPSGEMAVFKRTTKDRLPITRKYGPSIPEMFIRRGAMKVINDVVTKKGLGIVQHEYEFRWTRAKGRV